MNIWGKLEFFKMNVVVISQLPILLAENSSLTIMRDHEHYTTNFPNKSAINQMAKEVNESERE
jgi:hypothetical protein